MASRNILDLSLDDIIKMKRSKKVSRGGGGAKRSDTFVPGRGQNRGSPRGRGTSSTRSRGTFRTRGNIQNRGGTSRRGTFGPRQGQGVIRGRAGRGVIRGRAGRGVIRGRGGQGVNRGQAGQGIIRGRAGQGVIRVRAGQGVIRGRGGQGRGRGNNFNESRGTWIRGQSTQTRGLTRGAARGTFRGRGTRGGRGYGRFGSSRPTDIQQTQVPQRTEATTLRERHLQDTDRSHGYTSQPVPSSLRSTTVTGVGKRLAVHRQIAMKKVQQAKKLLVGKQQNSRTQARVAVLSKRRGIKSRSSLDSPLKVRVGVGAVVNGLRSDKLLLQKIQQVKGRHSQQTLQRLAQLAQKRERIANIRERGTPGLARRGNFGGSTVSLSSDHGLRVSIRNTSASTKTSFSPRARPRNRTRLNRNGFSYDNPRNLPTTITLYNERARPPSPPPLQSRNMRRNIMHSRDAFPRVNGSVGKLRTEPQPHRQTLDSKIQKEIAMLQGKSEVTLNSGPGPGVKGFQLVPSKTTTSLSERFTHERMVTS